MSCHLEKGVSLPVYLRPGGAVVPLALLEGRGPQPLQLLTQLLQLLLPHSKNKKQDISRTWKGYLEPFITVCMQALLHLARHMLCPCVWSCFMRQTVTQALSPLARHRL